VVLDNLINSLQVRCLIDTNNDLIADDSIVVADISVLPDVVVIPLDTTVCFADLFISHNDTVYNQLGCDSIITEYKVKRLPDVIEIQVDTTVCFVDPFVLHNDTVRNQLNCDSIITKYIVTRLPDVVVIPIDTTVCFADPFVSHNDTVRNQLDCDSIITKYIVTWLPDVVVIPIDTTACFADPFVSHNDTVRNQLGCDSIITIYAVTHLPEIRSEFSKIVCPPYTWNTETYDRSGDYDQIFTAVNGCDSIVTLHLTINPAPETTEIIRKGSSNILICADNSPNIHYEWGMEEFIGGEWTTTTLISDSSYQYMKFDTIDNQHRYFVDIHYGDNGCTTRSYYYPEPQQTATNIQKITVFPNPAKEHFSVSLGQEVQGNVVVSLQNLSGQTLRTKQVRDYQNDEVLQFDLKLPDGIYLLVVQTNKDVLTSKLVIK
jgi:hypothetical protein